MNIAILAISTLSLAASVGTLVIMHKTAKKLDEAGTKVKTDVETFKVKTNRNIAVIKTALGNLEM